MVEEHIGIRGWRVLMILYVRSPAANGYVPTMYPISPKA